MRGEYPVHRITSMRMWGSPPHAWRIPKSSDCIEREAKITSTCVENTIYHTQNASQHQDHLHMRGEYSQTPLQVMTQLGSPPHAWRIL